MKKNTQTKKDKELQEKIEKRWLSLGMTESQLAKIKKHIEFAYQFKH